MVHAHRRSINIFRHERTVAEFLCRQFGHFPISGTHLHTGKAELAFCTPGQKTAAGVDNKAMAVGHGTADGDIAVRTPALQAEGGYQVGALGRAVAVVQLDTVADQTRHALT